MKLVNIDDKYIEKLRMIFPNVMDNKRFHRTHTRKYLGVILQMNGKYYYAPFSSPKEKDYLPDGKIKKNNMFMLRMTKNEGDSKVLLGTIKLHNMLPVPLKYVNSFVFEDEKDQEYIDVLNDEFKWITKNQHLIEKYAKQIYEFKKHESENINESNKKQYYAIVPFLEIERYIDNYEI